MFRTLLLRNCTTEELMELNGTQRNKDWSAVFCSDEWAPGMCWEGVGRSIKHIIQVDDKLGGSYLFIDSTVVEIAIVNN